MFLLSHTPRIGRASGAMLDPFRSTNVCRPWPLFPASLLVFILPSARFPFSPYTKSLRHISLHDGNPCREVDKASRSEKRHNTSQRGMLLLTALLQAEIPYLQKAMGTDSFFLKMFTFRMTIPSGNFSNNIPVLGSNFLLKT